MAEISFAQLVHHSRRVVKLTFFFGFFINLLTLTVPLYMVQIFDRVLASKNYDTLIYLTLITLVALVVFSLLDWTRNKILAITADWLDGEGTQLILQRGNINRLGMDAYSLFALQDVNTIRQFFAGNTVATLTDAFWTPLFLLVIFLFSISLGVITLLGGSALLAMAFWSQKISTQPASQLQFNVFKNQQYIDAILKDTLHQRAYGNFAHATARWLKQKQQNLQDLATLQQKNAWWTTAAKGWRLWLQVILLAVGAYLVMQGKLLPGAMIAVSIIASRALAPIEQSFAVWKNFQSTKEAYARLKGFIEPLQNFPVAIKTNAYQGNVAFEHVIYLIDKKYTVLQNVNFTLSTGQMLAVIGPTGAGKTSLLRLAIGLLNPTSGAVWLDGFSLRDWSNELLQNEIGYLAQDDALIRGTVQENIFKMQTPLDFKAISLAAEIVGAHAMINSLSQGYETPIEFLSPGQQQLILLARAFVNKPKLIVLDMPEANLDNAGRRALWQALQWARQQKITLLIATQHPALLKIADQGLLLLPNRPAVLGTQVQLLEWHQKLQEKPATE